MGLCSVIILLELIVRVILSFFFRNKTKQPRIRGKLNTHKSISHKTIILRFYFVDSSQTPPVCFDTWLSSQMKKPGDGSEGQATLTN